MIITGLIANCTLFLTYMFILTQMYRDQPIDIYKNSVKTKIALYNGLFGVLVMFFAIPIDDRHLINLCSLLVLLTSHYGGAWFTLLTTGILIAGAAFMDGMQESFLGWSVTSLIIGAGAVIICRYIRHYWYRWLAMIGFLIAATLIQFYLFYGPVIADLYIPFTFCMLTAGIGIAYLNQYFISYHFKLLMLKEASTRDFLTGLHNHRSFDHSFNTFLEEAMKKGEALSLLMMDLDYFKKINDTYGHPAGDEVLRQLGQILSKCAVSSEVVSRSGGEEFSLLMPGTAYSDACQRAEAIRSAVERQPFFLPDGTCLHITLSIGVASFPDTEGEELKDKADRALYKAKHSGRNKVC